MAISETGSDIEGKKYTDLDMHEDDVHEEEMRLMLRMIFVKYNQDKIGEIKQAITSGDIKSAHRLVHTLKGNAGQVEKTELYKIAEKIETLLRDENLPIPEDAMAALENELALALEEFKPLIDEAQENTDGLELSTPHGAQGDEQKSRVLIIDDNAANTRVLLRILEPDYAVSAIESGQDAIETVKEYSPDVILYDALAQGVDGYAIIAELRQTETTNDIPVILLTSESDAGAEEKALELGVSEYIVKPFSPAVVKLRIRNQVQLSKLRGEMKSALEAAHAANRAKSDFLANMSKGLQALMNAEFLRNIGHELKTSLTRIHTSVINAADLLDYGMDRDEMLESLEDAGQEIMRMADLINGEISHYTGEGSMDG